MYNEYKPNVMIYIFRKEINRLHRSTETKKLPPTPGTLAKAIFTVNRHAKTAPNNKFLYKLKHEAILKLLREGNAQKKGLHFSNNPKFSQQQSDVLVQCHGFTFHIPPSKEDFQTLPHLGALNSSIRNPKVQMSLNTAKNLLQTYTGLQEEYTSNQFSHRKTKGYEKPVFKKLGESYGSIRNK